MPASELLLIILMTTLPVGVVCYQLGRIVERQARRNEDGAQRVQRIEQRLKKLERRGSADK